MKTILAIAAIAAAVGILGYFAIPTEAETDRELIIIDEPRPSTLVVWIKDYTDTCADGDTLTKTPRPAFQHPRINVLQEGIHPMTHGGIFDSGAYLHQHNFLADAIEIQGGSFTVAGTLVTSHACSSEVTEWPIVDYAEVSGLCGATEWDLTSESMNVTYNGKAVCHNSP